MKYHLFIGQRPIYDCDNELLEQRIRFFGDLTFFTIVISILYIVPLSLFIVTILAVYQAIAYVASLPNK